MATQPELNPPDPDDVLRIEVGRMRWSLEQLNIALFGGPGVIGMREQHGKDVLALQHNDKILAERINDMLWPKIAVGAFTLMAVIFAGIGIEVFLIKLHEMHLLGLL